jgi:hypothetical protein
MVFMVILGDDFIHSYWFFAVAGVKIAYVVVSWGSISSKKVSTSGDCPIKTSVMCALSL